MTPFRRELLAFLQLFFATVSRSEDATAAAVCAGADGSCRPRSQRPRGSTIQAAMQDIESQDQNKEMLQMLQIKGAIARTHQNTDGMTREIAMALPINWVHVPKCGSSFLNTIVHLPGVCPSYPDDMVISRETYGGAFLDNFKRSHDMDSECPGLLQSNLGHHAIEKWPGWQEGKGHFMVMLRQPEQRLISAYKDLTSAFIPLAVTLPSERQVVLDIIMRRDRSWGGWPTDQMPTVREFAEYNAGCATRMLVRDGFSCGGSGGMPTAAEVAEAKRRLRVGFAFVGITDQWALSMCLFSKMFKVGCHAHQFLDARPGRESIGLEGDYPEWLMEGFRDRYDGELYAEALSIFKENLELYNVSEASCAPCFKQASVSLASTRTKVWYQDEQHNAAL